MKLTGDGRKFVVEKQAVPIDPIWQFYKVEERESERLLRTFIAKISHTQNARPDVEVDIARWCGLYPEKLPNDGGMVPIDPDYVQKY